MQIIISGPITHLCPYVEEVDVGTVEISCHWSPGLTELELGDLSRQLQAYHDTYISHEALTQEIADELADHHPTVVTRWNTAGLAVECRAVPHIHLQPSDT
jgi:NADPH-dependent 7-cyano-7-deazaguanine reductase QueF